MAPSKQACKNNEKFSYSGKEMSPLGLGYCADAETVGSFMEGKDGKTWIVGVKNNEKVWIRAPENKQLEKEAPEIEAVDEEVKPEPDEEVKPKKKAAPKKKQAVEPEPVEATESDVDSEAAKPEPVEAAPEKSKRKYTKKTKQTEAEESEPAEPAPEKPKRKYTKKTKPVTEGDEQLPAKPKTKRGPSGYNLYIGQKINEFRASEQGLKTTEYMKKAQDAWRALSKTEQEEISKELKEAAAQAAAVVEIDA